MLQYKNQLVEVNIMEWVSAFFRTKSKDRSRVPVFTGAATATSKVFGRNDERIGTRRARSGAIIIICGRRGRGRGASGGTRARRAADTKVAVAATVFVSSTRSCWRPAWRHRKREAPSARRQTRYPAVLVIISRTVCSWNALEPPRSPSGALCPA